MAPIENSNPDYAGYIFAALMGLGGLMGFVRRRSLISLVAGSASALALLYGSNRISTNPNDVSFNLWASWAICAVMTIRFVTTWKFMPAGLVTWISLGMGIYYALLMAHDGTGLHLRE